MQSPCRPKLRSDRIEAIVYEEALDDLRETPRSGRRHHPARGSRRHRKQSSGHDAGHPSPSPPIQLSRVARNMAVMPADQHCRSGSERSRDGLGLFSVRMQLVDLDPKQSGQRLHCMLRTQARTLLRRRRGYDRARRRDRRSPAGIPPTGAKNPTRAPARCQPRTVNSCLVWKPSMLTPRSRPPLCFSACRIIMILGIPWSRPPIGRTRPHLPLMADLAQRCQALADASALTADLGQYAVCEGLGEHG